MKVEDIPDVFQYQAWIGYKWEDVEFPKNGFASKKIISECFKEGIARIKPCQKINAKTTEATKMEGVSLKTHQVAK